MVGGGRPYLVATRRPGPRAIAVSAIPSRRRWRFDGRNRKPVGTHAFLSITLNTLRTEPPATEGADNEPLQIELDHRLDELHLHVANDRPHSSHARIGALPVSGASSERSEALEEFLAE